MTKKNDYWISMGWSWESVFLFLSKSRILVTKKRQLCENTKSFSFKKKGSKWPCYEEKQIDIIMFRQSALACSQNIPWTLKVSIFLFDLNLAKLLSPLVNDCQPKYITDLKKETLHWMSFTGSQNFHGHGSSLCPQNSVPDISLHEKWWPTVLEREISCSQWGGSACTRERSSFFLGGPGAWNFCFFPCSQCVPLMLTKGSHVPIVFPIVVP